MMKFNYPPQHTSQQMRAIGLACLHDVLLEDANQTLFGCDDSEEYKNHWRTQLQRDWKVTCGSSLIELKNWLIEQGGYNAAFSARARFLNTIDSKRQLSYIDTYKQEQEEYQVLQFVKRSLPELTHMGIKAWDIATCIHLFRRGAFVGYISEEKAWECIFEAADLAFSCFLSWREFALSFLYGRQFWKKEFTVNSILDIYCCWKTLLTTNDSPVNTFYWHNKLNVIG
ncbi:DUF1266 domain-containing protein [Zooshikella harenae]|uniref:DUF1266 domain-containing protein n=1 Tax=Zooshikella harenae TaxID=2827238 RepID=A0ABS5Z9J5_9GAMM|nr:DUF1266 domain-containing protein [Zooshikella harenae]MBU2710563.1 DUF1266 domain-containing protein [Zooshikella harenae]